MKICVVGAGAIGGYVAVRLAHAGHAVSAIARGPHLAAIRANGLKLVEGEQALVADLEATDRIADLGTQDVVLLALKAHQITAVVDDLPVLLGTDTVLVTLQNGIPWWYFQKLGGSYADRVVETVDPGGRALRRDRPEPGHRLHRLSGRDDRRTGGDPAHRGQQVPGGRARWQRLGPGPDGLRPARAGRLHVTGAR